MKKMMGTFLWLRSDTKPDKKIYYFLTHILLYSDIFAYIILQYAVSIQRCYLVVLDPKRIGETDALVARLEVPKHLNFPLGFHGFWANSN